MGLLRFVAIAILIVLGVRLLTRVLLPLLAKYFIRKAGKNMEERARTTSQGEKIYERGNVSIRKKNQKKSDSHGTDDDEYIDFEEVSD